MGLIDVRPGRALARMATATAALALVACASGTTTIGPLTLEVPDGWRVTDREATSLKLTNGTIADPTSMRPGTATAVFDIYVESGQTVDAFAAYLDEQGVEPERTAIRVGGYPAERFAYQGRSVGGMQEAVIVPRWRVFILYRAAFRGADAAFRRGRAAFRRAVGSISFGTSAASGAASGRLRHGPTSGKSAITASAAAAAMSANPN